MAAYDALPPEVRQVVRNLLYKPHCPRIVTAVRRLVGVPPQLIADFLAAEAVEAEARLIAELGSRTPHAAAQATVLRAEPLTG